MFDGKAARPKWWSRPEGAGAPGTGFRVETEPQAQPTRLVAEGDRPSAVSFDKSEAVTAQQPLAHAVAPLVDGDATVPQAVGDTNPYAAPVSDTVPAFRPDPYGTPPYGGPGPYAPAPPVQHPSARHHPAPHQHALPQPIVPHPRPQPLAVPLGGHYAPWQRPLPWGVLPPPPPRRRGRGRMIVGILLVALFAGVLGGAVGAAVQENGGVSDVELPQAPPDKVDRAPDSVAGIAASTLPGVVYIHVRGSGKEATGTGFVIDGRGHILTNSHVVEPAARGGDISVTFNSGTVRAAEIVGRDSGYDLAVIKVGGVHGLHPLSLGNSDSVQVGDPVVAIGAPYDLEGTVTSGIISAKDRPIAAGGEGDGSDISYVNALQTDAPINPGNSGGPLVNTRGQVIGINSAIRSASGGASPFGGAGQGGSIGLGFAIPVNQARRVAEELINTGRATHAIIGVQLNMSYDGDGAQVGKGVGGSKPVTPGGPGDKAGLKPEDVITRVDGRPVHTGEELIVKIRSRKPGDTMRLTVERDGHERQVDVTLDRASGD
ncbi:S1C family serine protease [Wenjunlia tyrosinilytica]|uniref:Protease n=1 Tax=Wenjunlia tyrosinilytica TaxID=1544741 RepID=A0A918DX32_9ACTN|nr:trypsin-like peptidase domain-containing protein [Wenjunlia tyrosinilytica]GGO85909.1 protease [Wenjunlia tyrosinilytica]